ncbi:CAP domain-containing protein [Streptomyces naphthomycinicus]|uniref:CAP domain-containing protein n=1 Tax=Streptomyces naphthomycinicus TaxID=2872625 RepID=UPI001CED282C|nr:CAP domain-containing protein [Streptomyces sp. TML10]
MLPAAAGASAAPAAPAGPNTVQQANASEILALENAEREKAGCSALSMNSQLTAAAQAHSEDMAKNNFFSHTGSDGSSIAQRVEKAGFSPSIPTAENIHQGGSTSQQVFDSWMGSAPHKAAILNCQWKQTGLAGASGNLWTQLFGT